MRLGDLDALKKVVINNFDNLQAYFLKDFIKEIDNAPTVETSIEHFVDLEQLEKCANFIRQQGEWVNPQISLSGVFLAECSICGEDIMTSSLHYNFCPNCGADMRGTEYD